jgi:hypothetical protein
LQSHPSPKAEDLLLQLPPPHAPYQRTARAHSHLLLPVPAVILNAVKDPKEITRAQPPLPFTISAPDHLHPPTLDTPATIKSGETKARHKPGFRL